MAKKTNEINSEELLEKGKFTIEYLAPCGIYCGLCHQVIRDEKKCYGCHSKKG